MPASSSWRRTLQAEPRNSRRLRKEVTQLTLNALRPPSRFARSGSRFRYAACWFLDSHDTELPWMIKGHAQHLFRKYAPAMAYVVVEKPNGDESIGSAFHVGEGVFVTARHVVDGCALKEVRLSEPVPVATHDFLPEAPKDYDETMRKWLGFVPMWRHYQTPLKIVSAP